MEVVQSFRKRDNSCLGKGLLFSYYCDVEGNVQLTLRRGECKYGGEHLMRLEDLENLRKEFPGEVSNTLLNPASDENTLFISSEVPIAYVIGKYMKPMDTTYGRNAKSLARFMNRKKDRNIVDSLLLDTSSVVETITT